MALADLKPYAFTKDTASANGKRSGEARRAKRNADKPPTFDNVQATLNAQLILVKEQIASTRDILNDVNYCYCKECKRGGIEPHHRAQLLKALDSLLDRQRILLNVPAPAPWRIDQRQPKRAITSGPMIELRPASPTTGSVPPTDNQAK